MTNDTMFRVRDKNATIGPRIHDMPGARYALKAHEDTEVPEKHALLFLRDEAFEVRDDTGNLLASAGHLANERDANRVLASDETIARYEELTAAALLSRAVLRPGAGEFTRKTPRAELIEFLTTAPMKAELPRHLRARDTSLPEGPESADAGMMMDHNAAGAMLGSTGRDPAQMAAEAEAAAKRAALMGG